MRTVIGALASAFVPDDDALVLIGHRIPYKFDERIALGDAIARGTFVRLTLILLEGPNPSREPKLHFEVERIAQVEFPGLCLLKPSVGDPLIMSLSPRVI